MIKFGYFASFIFIWVGVVELWGYLKYGCISFRNAHVCDAPAKVAAPIAVAVFILGGVALFLNTRKLARRVRKLDETPLYKNDLNVRLIVDEISLQIKRDDIEIGWLANLTKERLPDADDSERKRILIDAIVVAVENQIAIVSDFRENENPQWFNWLDNSESVRAELNKRYQALGHAPIFGTGEIGFLRRKNV